MTEETNLYRLKVSVHTSLGVFTGYPHARNISLVAASDLMGQLQSAGMTSLTLYPTPDIADMDVSTQEITLMAGTLTNSVMVFTIERHG